MKQQIDEMLPQIPSASPHLSNEQTGARGLPKKIIAGMGNIPKLPTMSRSRRASISEKFGFVRKVGNRSRSVSKSSAGDRDSIGITITTATSPGPLAVASGLDAVTEVVSPVALSHQSLTVIPSVKHTPQQSVDGFAARGSGANSPMRLEQAVSPSSQSMRTSPQMPQLPAMKTIARKPVNSPDPNQCLEQPTVQSRGPSPAPRVDSPAPGASVAQRSRMTPSPQPYARRSPSIRTSTQSLQQRDSGTSLKDKVESRAEDGTFSAASVSTEASMSTSTSRSSIMNAMEHPLRMNAITPTTATSPSHSFPTPTPTLPLNTTIAPVADATTPLSAAILTPLSAATTTETVSTALTTPTNSAIDSRSPNTLDAQLVSPQHQSMTSFLASPDPLSQSQSPATTVASPSLGTLGFEESPSPGLDMGFDSPDLGRVVMNHAVNHKVNLSTGSFKPRVVEVRTRSRSRAGTGTGDGPWSRSRAGTVNLEQGLGLASPLEDLHEGLGLGLTGLDGPHEQKPAVVELAGNPKIELPADEQSPQMQTAQMKSASARHSLYEMPEAHSPQPLTPNETRQRSDTVESEHQAKFEATITDFRRVSIQDSGNLTAEFGTRDDSALPGTSRNEVVRKPLSRADTMPVLSTSPSQMEKDAASETASMFEGTIRDFARVSVQDASQMLFTPDQAPEANQSQATSGRNSIGGSAAPSISSRRPSLESMEEEKSLEYIQTGTGTVKALTPVKESHEGSEDSPAKPRSNVVSHEIYAPKAETGTQDITSNPVDDVATVLTAEREESQPTLSPVTEHQEPESPRPVVPAKDSTATSPPPVPSDNTKPIHSNSSSQSKSIASDSKSTTYSAHSKSPSISDSHSISHSKSTSTSGAKSPSHSKTPSVHSNGFSRSNTMKSFKSYRSKDGKRDTMRSLLDAYYGNAEDDDEVPELPHLDVPEVPDVPDASVPVSATIADTEEPPSVPEKSIEPAAPAAPPQRQPLLPEPVTKVTMITTPQTVEVPQKKEEESKVQAKVEKSPSSLSPVLQSARAEPNASNGPSLSPMFYTGPKTDKAKNVVPKNVVPKSVVPKSVVPKSVVPKKQTPKFSKQERKPLFRPTPTAPASITLLLPEIDTGTLGFGLGGGLDFGGLDLQELLDRASPTNSDGPKSPSLPPLSPQLFAPTAFASEPSPPAAKESPKKESAKPELKKSESNKPEPKKSEPIVTTTIMKPHLPEPSSESPLFGLLESPRIRQETFPNISSSESNPTKVEEKGIPPKIQETQAPADTVGELRQNDGPVKRRAIPAVVTRQITGVPPGSRPRDMKYTTRVKGSDASSSFRAGSEMSYSQTDQHNNRLELVPTQSSVATSSIADQELEEKRDDVPPPVPPKDTSYESSIRPGGSRTDSGSIRSYKADSIASSRSRQHPTAASTKLGQTPKGMSASIATRKAKAPKRLDLANPPSGPGAGKGVIGSMSKKQLGSPTISIMSKISNVTSIARGNGSVKSPRLIPPSISNGSMLGPRNDRSQFGASTNDLNRAPSMPGTPGNARPVTSKSVKNAAGAPMKRLNLFPSNTQSPRLNGFFTKSMSNLRERAEPRDYGYEESEHQVDNEEDLIGEEADSALPTNFVPTSAEQSEEAKRLARSMTQILGNMDNQADRKGSWKRMFRRKA
jgi:hypothetical protein